MHHLRFSETSRSRMTFRFTTFLNNLGAFQEAVKQITQFSTLELLLVIKEGTLVSVGVSFGCRESEVPSWLQCGHTE